MRTLRDLISTAAVGRRRRVCGRRLLPLTLGHLRILDACGVSEVRDLDSLILAVTICSRPAKDFERLMEAPFLALRLACVTFRASSRLGVELANFGRYWEEMTAVPDVAFINGATADSQSAIPAWLHLRTALCAKCGYSPAEADDCTYQLAVLTYYAFWESEGKAEMLPATSDEMTAEADARRDEILRQAEMIQSRAPHGVF